MQVVWLDEAKVLFKEAVYFGVFRCADFLDGFLRIVADSSIVRAKINRT